MGLELGTLLRDCYALGAFRKRTSACRGVFDSFEDAIASAPHDKPIGYDHPTVAAHYANNVEELSSDFDYPLLFHLNHALTRRKRPLTVFDLGGNLGVQYRLCRKYLDLSSVQWVVCDVPAIAAAGRDMYADDPNISFVTDIGELSAASFDVFLAAGSLQHVDLDVALRAIERSPASPELLIITTAPVHEGPPFVSLQNGGLSYYPHQVFNRAELLSRFEAAGFILKDEWRESTGLRIPFHPERSIPRLSGFCFVPRRRGATRHPSFGKPGPGQTSRRLAQR
jgi:putative methyltransferase (TIGR04325 family)